MPFVRGTKIQVVGFFMPHTGRSKFELGDFLTVSSRRGSGWMRARNERTHEVITLRNGPHIAMVPGLIKSSRDRAEDAKKARAEAAYGLKIVSQSNFDAMIEVNRKTCKENIDLKKSLDKSNSEKEALLSELILLTEALKNRLYEYAKLKEEISQLYERNSSLVQENSELIRNDPNIQVDEGVGHRVRMTADGYNVPAAGDWESSPHTSDNCLMAFDSWDEQEQYFANQTKTKESEEI